MVKSDNVHVVESTEDHVKSLSVRLRKGDIDEVWASSGLTPEKALYRSWRNSEMCASAVFDGVPVLMFGCSRFSLISRDGCPWMLGSDEIFGRLVGVEVAKWSKYYVERMMERFTYLENYIDSRQKKSIRWLKWMGFHVEQPESYGFLGLPFHRFWKGVKHG